MTVEHSLKGYHITWASLDRKGNVGQIKSKRQCSCACCSLRGKMLVEEIFLKYSQAELLINARYSPLQIKQRGFLPSSMEK